MLGSELLDIKASGFYFQEFDRSQIVQVAEQLRVPLVPIVTKKGPINNPVYVGQGDINTFRRIFGERDRTQEFNGNYSWLAAFYVLRSSAAIFINLRSMDDVLDTAQLVSFSASASDANAGVQTHPYTSLLKTDGFWVADRDTLIRTANTNDVVLFGNLGTRDVSIFMVRNTTGISGYNTTVNDYYTARGEDVPTYLDGSSLMNDYTVDVYMFNKKFDVNSINNFYYGYIFDASGNVKKTVQNVNNASVSGLEELTTIRESEFVGKYTGSLIPTAIDEAGNSFAIDTVINNDINIHKVVCALNENVIMEHVDWLSNLELDPDFYPLGGQPLSIDLTGQTIINIPDSTTVIDNTTLNKLAFSSYDLSALTVSDIDAVTGGTVTQNVIRYNKIRLAGTHSGTYEYDIANKNTIYVHGNMPHTVGESYFGIDGRNAKITSSTYKGQEVVLLLTLHSNELPIQGDNTVFPTNVDGDFVYPVGHPDEGELVEYDGTTGYPLDGIAGTVIPFPTLSDVEYDAILADWGETRMVYECKLNKELHIEGYTGAVNSGTSLREMTITLTDATSIDIFSLDGVYAYHVPNVEYLVSGYKPYNITSYKVRAAQFMDGTASRQNAILDMLISGNMLKALTNIDKVDFRYVVDAFKTYISSNEKYQFVNLAKEQRFSAAILNEPFTDDLQNSTDPYFRGSVGGAFDTAYYKTGGNTQLPYTTLYSKPTTNASYGYSVQNVLRTENRRPSKFIGAPIYYSLFNQKLLNRRASDAIMGTSYPITFNDIVAPDYEFSDTERGDLEPYGYNVIVRKNGIMQVYGNTTMQYVTKSALSYISNREVLIEFRREIIPLLTYLVGKTNTPQLRTYAKGFLDNVCKRWLDAGALTRYINTVDESNNTSDIIENAYAILDTQLWFSGKMQKVVHRTYVESNVNATLFEVQ